MTTFDWLYVGLLSIAIISGVLSLRMIFFLIKDRGRLVQVSKNRPKNKVKHKKWLVACKKIENKKKRHRRSLILLLTSTLLFSGIAVYGRYYQATNLGQADTENIADSYSLIGSVQNEIDNSSENKSQAVLNLDVLARRLSSFGMKRSSARLTKDGQLMLNRYYNQVYQLGRNLNGNIGKIADDESLQTEFMSDIEKINGQQKKIFDYYSIDETAVTNKKAVSSQE